MDELIYKQANTIYDLWVDRGNLIKKLDGLKAAERKADALQTAMHDIADIFGLDILSFNNAEVVEAVKAMADPHTIAGLQTAAEELTAERDREEERADSWKSVANEYLAHLYRIHDKLADVDFARATAEVERDELATLVGEISDAKEARADRDDAKVAHEIATGRADYLRNRRDELKTDCDNLVSHLDAVAKERDELQAKLDRLREAVALVLICHEPDNPCGCDLSGHCAWHHAYSLAKDEYLDLVE